jgi:hypothetical protein
MARRRTTTRRKSATTTRRRRSVAKPVARRRRSTRKKGLLSEMFSPAMATGGAKVLISGAVGGIGASFLGKLIPASTTPEMKAVYGIGAGFITSTLLKMPNVGAGMSAVAVADLMKGKGLLSEGYAYADNLNSLPMVLNEGEAMYLADNGMYLAENEYGYNVGYYPAGFGG